MPEKELDNASPMIFHAQDKKDSPPTLFVNVKGKRDPPPTLFVQVEGRKDQWATYLYLLLTLSVIAASVVFAFDIPFSNANNSTTPLFVKPGNVAAVCIAATMAFLGSISYIFFMHRYPLFFLTFCFWFVITGTIVAGVLFFIIGALGPGVVCILIGIIVSVFWFSVKKRIPFSAFVLEYATSIAVKRRGVMFSGYFGLVLTLFFLSILASG